MNQPDAMKELNERAAKAVVHYRQNRRVDAVYDWSRFNSLLPREIRAMSKGRIFKVFEWVVVALIATHGFPAFACPDNQYESCFLGECVCLPKVAGDIDIEHGAEHLKNEIIRNTGVPALESWIILSRNNAIVGSQPIPPQIRQALSGYIEQDVMNRARFKVGDIGVLNLAGLVIEYGDRINGREVSAVTLIDVIVFRDANDAFNNPSIWAHELTHVKQFRDWGTRDFSIRYVRDVNSVEDPAYAVGNGYGSWRVGQTNKGISR